MTKTLKVRHLRALIQSFVFFFHQGAVKLTTKDTKDTKKFAIAPRCGEGRVCVPISRKCHPSTTVQVRGRWAEYQGQRVFVTTLAENEAEDIEARAQKLFKLRANRLDEVRRA